MNNAEKALVRDVLGWFRNDLGLPSPGLKRGQLKFRLPRPEEALLEDPDPGLRLTASRWRRCLLYALLGGLLVAGAVFLWARWFHPGVFFFTAFMVALVYFLPILAAIVPDRPVVLEHGPLVEQELVRALALAYLNRHPLREAAHCLLDALLAPLLLSWQEGLAFWFTRQYFRERGRAGFQPGQMSLRGRITADLLRLPGRIGRGRVLRWFLLHS